MVSQDPDLDSFNRSHGVPNGADSCHTALVAGYVVVGHVPAGALIRLLDDRPDAVGLALPGMPADAPGMTEDPAHFESQPVMLIRNDGSLAPFHY